VCRYVINALYTYERDLLFTSFALFHSLIGVGSQYDPSMVITKDQHRFASWMNDWNISVAFSTDLGETFGLPINVATGGLSFGDKPWGAISPNGDTAFVVFNSANPYLALSTNGGKSFQTARRMATDNLYYYDGGMVYMKTHTHTYLCAYRYSRTCRKIHTHTLCTCAHTHTHTHTHTIESFC